MNRVYLAGLFFLAAILTQGQWSWQYPIPQGNRLNKVVAADSQHLYAIGHFGTILKSSDGGNSWTLSDSVTSSNLNGITLLSDGTGFIAGDNGTILRMQSNGVWDTVPSGTFYNLFSVDATSGSHVVVAGYKGIILLNTGSGFVLVNSGTTKTLYDVEFVDNQTAIIVGEEGTILRSGDGGSSWSSVNSGTTRALNDVYFVNSTLGFIGGNEGLILRTSDGGVTWQDVSNSQAHDNIYSVHFIDSDIGWVCGAKGLLYRSTTGGSYWQYQSMPTNLVFRSILVQQTGEQCDSILFCGDNGLIYKSDTLCGEYRNITHGKDLSLNAIKKVSDTNYIAVGGHLFNNTPLMLTSNDGMNWQESTPDTINKYLTDLFILNDTAGYITGKSGGLYRSLNSFSDWVPVKTGVTKMLYSVSFADTSMGMAVGADGTILRRAGNDTLWEKVTTSITAHLFKVLLNPGGNGFITGDDGKLFRVKEYGDEITPITTGTSQPLYDIFFPTDTLGFACGFDGTILKVRHTPVAIEVEQVESGVTTPLNEIYFPNPDTGFIAGEGGVVLKSTDRGNTWYPVYTGTQNNFRGLWFLNGMKGWVVGSGPTVLATEKGGGPVITPGIPEEPENERLPLVLFPNPAGNDLQVGLPVQGESIRTIEIYTISGRLVLQKKVLPALFSEPVHINTGNLPEGLYLVRVLTEKNSYTGKLLIGR
ncbi:MAG: hypothetical protein Kow00127_17370 [Bacteroidales bacterium]